MAIKESEVFVILRSLLEIRKGEKMLYCFIDEDIKDLSCDDPLLLQVNYAKRINKCCFCHLTKGIVTNEMHEEISIKNKKIFLRSTYNNMFEAMSLLESLGADLVENAKNVNTIEDWIHTNIATRKILKTTVEELCEGEFSCDVLDFLLNTENIFLKSLHKGFSCKLKSTSILNQENKIIEFLRQYHNSDLLIAPLLNIKKDSLGCKEARFFIMNNEIINCSRMVHSVKHAVPKTLRKKAAEIVEKLSQKANFPDNYVLDIGEFEDNDTTYVDVVEVNPITASMCYVNNSVFTTYIPEAETQRLKLNMGIEYCFDAIDNDSRYFTERLPNVSYEYISTKQFDFFEE